MDAGALAIPIKGGAVKKGMYALLKGKPCYINSVSVSKTGKHGHAKCHFDGTDIFTGKKVIGLESSTHNMLTPIVTKTDYLVIDINEEGYCSLMDDDSLERG